MVSPAACSSNNLQYRAVLSHLKALTTALRVTPGAESSLLLKFQELLWLATGAKASAKELVTLSLNRINNDFKDYDVFINMLRNLKGMEHMVNKMAGAFHSRYTICNFMHHYNKKLMLSILLVLYINK